MLLYHLPDVTSFADIRTINVILHPTYQAAAKAFGLLESDEQWEHCIEVAITVQSPFSLRCLFAIIIAFCEPVDPYQLWSKFIDSFSEDYAHQMRNDESIDPILVEIEVRTREHCFFRYLRYTVIRVQYQYYFF